MVVDHKQYKCGTIFVDTVANKVQSTDIVWANCANSSSMSPALIPLDGSATTVKNASRFATTPAPPCTGRGGIEA
jgi:hypothetical protein